MGRNIISSYLGFLIWFKSFLAGARPTQAFWNITRLYTYIYICQNSHCCSCLAKTVSYTGKRVFLVLWQCHSAHLPKVQFCLQNLSFWFKFLPKQHSILSDVQPGWADTYHTRLMRGKRRKRGKGPVSLSGKLELKDLQHLRGWSIPFSGEGRREEMSLTHMLPQLLCGAACMTNTRGTTEWVYDNL